MFKKIASDAFGLSDIGIVIKPEDYDKTDADDYVMHEDGEKIFFLIKSKSDEYCFTNKALIHLDGTSATSKKRTLYRYDYYAYPVSQVALETAGTIDLDIEIKFHLGNQAFSVDVNKNSIYELKDLYKSLIKIAEILNENKTYLDYANQSLGLASKTLSTTRGNESSLYEEFKQINETAFTWLVEKKKLYNVKDFTDVFELYIHN